MILSKESALKSNSARLIHTRPKLTPPPPKPPSTFTLIFTFYLNSSHSENNMLCLKNNWIIKYLSVYDINNVTHFKFDL